jgi:hypothetical protein
MVVGLCPSADQADHRVVAAVCLGGYRLRKQRGLRREDFEPALSAKTIARIERGEELSERLHDRTWQILSEKLGVAPKEIGTF